MISEIELVYFSGCPNVEDARANLRAVLVDLGRDPHWQEWNVDDSEAPDRVRGFASPAVLVGGIHVLGEQPLESQAAACSASGPPPASVIAEAIASHS